MKVTNLTTKEKILRYVKNNKKARVEDLRINLGLSRQLIHRYLKFFTMSGWLIRTGTPPLVFYELKKEEKPIISPFVPPSQRQFIDDRFYWISPAGKIMPGFNGFKAWAISIKQIYQLSFLAKEYISVRKTADKHYEQGLINASFKIKKTFTQVYIDKTLYLDFYSLPKYGKTRLGQLVLYAKQAQQTSLISKIAQEVKPKVSQLIAKYHIRAVAFIPPTIPRQIQFLKELRKLLALKIPEIKLVKAYSGEVLVAQKTLNKLEQRIENAHKTIFIKESPTNYENVLLIDDAVGSGSSLNETAKKLKEENGVKKVIGFAIVGSYKGFDVIQEV
jgi:predicted amidophosphoribosyltransferase